MKSWVRHFLPFGFVRASQLASELARIGLPRRKALHPATTRCLQRLNFDLLPTEALAGPPGYIIDVGANVGDWTADLRRLYQPAQVICIEPEPRLVDGLRRRFAADPLVKVLETAVGRSPGKAELNVMEDSAFNSLHQPVADVSEFYPPTFRVKETLQVRVLTLDSILADIPRVKVLKIDVQGHERDVLAGATDTLRRTDYVIMEANFRPHYEGEADFFELTTLMGGHGFCIGNYSKPKGGRRQALYVDVLYLRKDS